MFKHCQKILKKLQKPLTNIGTEKKGKICRKTVKNSQAYPKTVNNIGKPIKN